MAEIKKSNQLLKSYLGPGSTIVDQKSTRFTAPGENYGSLILSVEIKYKNEQNQEQSLPIIAKLIPENDWLRKLFKVQISFKKEMEFYNTVVPTLQEFQKENGIPSTYNFFPTYYGGRINLEGNSEEVDDDAAILIENLKLSGYKIVDRKIGFDLETTELILKDYAVFHSVPIALKLKKPKLFQEKIMPHIEVIPCLDQLQEDSINTMCQEKLDVAKENIETDHLVERVEKGFRMGIDNWKYPTVSPRQPFATIRHNDGWVNNFMVKFCDGKPISNKIIDFQLIDYGSPARDVIFFLFSSVQSSVIEEYYDRFIELYYKTFIDTLEDLKCDVRDFTFEAFEKELEYEARDSEFSHVLGMLKPLYADKDEIKDLKDLAESDLTASKISDLYKQKAWFVIKEFEKRNWI